MKIKIYFQPEYEEWDEDEEFIEEEKVEKVIDALKNLGWYELISDKQINTVVGAECERCDRDYIVSFKSVLIDEVTHEMVEKKTRLEMQWETKGIKEMEEHIEKLKAMNNNELIKKVTKEQKEIWYQKEVNLEKHGDIRRFLGEALIDKEKNFDSY
ncbi:MAG: hypothetical protein ABII01_00210 [Candidatus Woesearchaeota archaeon]